MSDAPARFALLQLPVLQRKNLSERVVLTLKYSMCKADVRPGDRLPAERQLAEAMSVSRTVLREALSQLLGEGLLQRESPRKLRFAEFDRERLAAELAPLIEDDTNLQDLVELRVFIEIGALEAIVRRATAEQLAEVERWVVQGEQKLAAREPLLLIDARFHAALLRIADNRTIDGLLPLIEENLSQSLLALPGQFMGSGSPDDYRVVAEHRRIYEALLVRDADAARLVMLAHLSPYLHRDWRHTRALEPRDPQLRPRPQARRPSGAGRARRS